ncbi:hypothetical protein [Nocardia asteroides]|uniref:hypothetical protein n=1 Tax=Nocardia asteroides TaxID=1824 RepID=UPI001E4A251C|nr:hypothetical protein [Nocardia asteroides]UGT58928.1 hypothetical protein LTT85_33110 [Nocardia asteroides]
MHHHNHPADEPACQRLAAHAARIQNVTEQALRDHSPDLAPGDRRSITEVVGGAAELTPLFSAQRHSDATPATGGTALGNHPPTFLAAVANRDTRTGA